MASSSAVQTRRQRGGQKKSVWSGWRALLPLVLGIVLTPFTIRLASVVALEGPKAFALLYPWVIALRSPALHFPADLVGSSSEWMLYLQFPIYGLLGTLTWHAGKYLRAFVVALIAHFSGLLAVVLLAYLGR
ncbi:MAG TPA: hypothetical protein VHZ09_03065 [Acidobacteriaceae bacterium]|nr:hypothetical protein [Acidobacteriaceae bacterium]